MEQNHLQKSIEELENFNAGFLEDGSYLVKRCLKLRKLPLENFTVEDLRIMIGQHIALDYLFPLALTVLQTDIFSEGDFYEGDLLQSVLSIKNEFWLNNKNAWMHLNDLLAKHKEELISRKINITDFEKAF